MSEERRKLLEEKLKAQNERLREKGARDDVATLTESFDAHGIPYQWHISASEVFSWVVDTYKIDAYGWFASSPHYQIVDGKYSCAEDALAMFKRLAMERNLALTDEVYFLWVYGPGSLFSFTIGDVLHKPVMDLLFDRDSEFWLAQKSGKWCFLVHHEGTAHLAVRRDL